MKLKTLLSIILGLFLTISVSAQNTTKVYGNLGIENVNIQVSNTSLGTITDARGYYELLLTKSSNPIELHYSCIGYQDTIVSILPKQMQKGSINISFSMRFKDYALSEVTVTEKAPEIAYAGKMTSIVDYEINDMGVYIIGYRTKGCILLHMSFDFDTLSFIPIDEKYQRLYKDVYNQIHLLSYDSAFQIGHRQYRGEYQKMELFYGMKSDQFYNIMGNNVAATDKVFITAEYQTKWNQELYFYCRKKGDSEASVWEHTRESAMLYVLENGMWCMPDCWPYVKPIYDPVFNLNDTLYFFDFDADRIVIYNNEAKHINTIPMTFHRKRTWKGEWEKQKSWKRIVMMDAPKTKFYTAFEEESVMSIKEINIKTGIASDIVRLSNFHFVQIPKMHNGVLYFLYPTGYDHRKALYKLKID